MGKNYYLRVSRQGLEIEVKWSLSTSSSLNTGDNSLCDYEQRRLRRYQCAESRFASLANW